MTINERPDYSTDIRARVYQTQYTEDMLRLKNLEEKERSISVKLDEVTGQHEESKRELSALRTKIKDLEELALTDGIVLVNPFEK